MGEESTKGLRTRIEGGCGADGMGRRGTSKAFDDNTGNKRNDPGQGENKRESM